jgi:selenocysteine lyase/cysteine desulfurase
MTNTSPKLIPSQRDLFDIPNGVTYLNCATLSPQLRSVTAAGMESVRAKASPWGITPPDWFSGVETLRGLAARVLETDAESIALVPSVSYGIAIAAANVRVERGQSIVLLHEQFPSNVYAWRELARRKEAMVRTVQRGAGQTPVGGWTEALLETIDANTAVVAVPHCHWTDGSLVNLVAVGEKAHSVGAAFVVDASQAVGAYPVDLSTVQPDFLVTVGYKWLLGPYSVGYMYVSPHWRANGTPIEQSWLSRKGSDDFASLVLYQDEFRSGARRFDYGECSNFVLVPMAIAALRQVLAWGVVNIQHSLSGLTAIIAREAASLGCVVPSERVGHMIGVRFSGGLPDQLGRKLADERIYASTRGNAIRIAPHLHNDEADVERLFRVLRALA